MEVLTVFFEAIDNILIGYTKRGKCELPEFLDKILKREDISSILSKVRDSKEISQEAIQEAINNFTDLISPDEIPEGLMKLWEEEQTPLGHMVPDVSLDVEFQCIELLRNKLFSLAANDRILYASMFAKEFDSKLFNTIDNLAMIDEKGYDITFAENSVISFMNVMIETFADFNIDIVDYLQKKSDCDPDFFKYKNFRDKRFVKTNGKVGESLHEPSNYQYNIDKLTQIYGFCNGDAFKIGFDEFIKAVSTADFSNIYNEKETKKAKTSFVISIIKDYVTPEEWYKKAANSINLTPSKCSGANVKSWADDIIFAIR